MTYSEFTVCTVLRSTVHPVTVCRLYSGAQSQYVYLYVGAQCSIYIIHSFVIIKQFFEFYNSLELSELQYDPSLKLIDPGKAKYPGSRTKLTLA